MKKYKYIIWVISLFYLLVLPMGCSEGDHELCGANFLESYNKLQNQSISLAVPSLHTMNIEDPAQLNHLKTMYHDYAKECDQFTTRFAGIQCRALDAKTRQKTMISVKDIETNCREARRVAGLNLCPDDLKVRFQNLMAEGESFDAKFVKNPHDRSLEVPLKKIIDECYSLANQYNNLQCLMRVDNQVKKIDASAFLCTQLVKMLEEIRK
jgi:hypothetical protein